MGSYFQTRTQSNMLVFSINVKELLALYMWLDSSGKNIKVCCVTWRVDNNSALQAIKKPGF